MPRVLPPELTDLIIDCLHDDPAALGACSLTCRAWVISSQAHIFHTILLVHTPAKKNIQQLLENSPHIAQYVRVLRMGRGGFVDQISFLNKVMPKISPKLINVRELEVAHVSFNELRAPTRSAFIKGFPNLRRLSLVACNFRRLRDFTSLILGHPYIECLESQGTTIWRSPNNNNNRPPGSLRHLRTLSWQNEKNPQYLINWVLSTHLPTSLHTIEVRARSVKDIPAISGLLNALGPSLENFDLDMAGVGHVLINDEDIFTSLSMSNNTSLRTICIKSTTGNRHARGSSVYARILEILSTVRSSRLKEITLHVECCAIKLLELARLDGILARAHFDGLCQVTFCLCGSGDGPKARRAVRYKMKGAQKRQLLVFERRFEVP